MKKYIISFTLVMIASLGYAQEKETMVIAPMAAPPEEGCIYCYKWNADMDHDGFGDPSAFVYADTKPAGYVANQSDLDDANPNITNIAPQTFYRDADMDTFGTSSVTVYYSVKPTGYVTNSSDCNDGDASLNPNTIWYRDADGDSFGVSAPTLVQCAQPAGYVRNSSDYNDATVNITNIAPQTFYRDADGDTFGTSSVTVYYSVMPAGYVTNSTDCNDGDTALNPNTVWYRDADRDGFGVSVPTLVQCTQPAGYVRNSSDCNDADATLTPNTIWYRDADGDGFGVSSPTLAQCAQPAGYVRNSSDYNDATVNITNIAPQTFYQDGDGDTYGNPGVSIYYSVKPAGYVSNNTDCNDADTTINPNTKWYADTDADGLGDPSSFLQQCVKPVGNHVLDNSDNCPLIRGTGTDCASVKAPSLDQNYIITTTYKQPTTTVFVNPDPTQTQTNITYFDGLGRPMQQIANQQSASGKDIITHIGYDDFGRQIMDYLPFASTATNMVYDVNASANTLAFYNTSKYENTANPYSKKVFEASPLNRVLKQAAPGTDWALNSGHEIKLDYQTNTAPDAVKLFSVTANWDVAKELYDIPTSLTPAVYLEFQLFKTVTYDENTAATPSESNGSTVEFKNKEGQMVLKRTYEASVKHDTYYVYDQFGNLTFVIPPLVDATTTISNTILGDLCYQYKYDSRNRLVEKKLPGKQWEFIVYDKLDRIVATGPAFPPFSDLVKSGWIITKYDAYNRPVLTGWMSSAATINSALRKTRQDERDAQTTNLSESRTDSTPDVTISGITYRYSNVAIPTSGYHVLTVNYYDNYNYPNAPTIPTSIEGQNVYYNAALKPIGLPTGSWIRAIKTSTSYRNETTYVLYDYKARPIRTFIKNHENSPGGYTQIDNKLDFSGKTLYTITLHKRTNGETGITIKDSFTYTDQDRLQTHTQQIGTGAVQLLAENTYDELGQLISKNVGNTIAVPLQKVDYAYNIRGWLTGINNDPTNNLVFNANEKDLFAFKINYNSTEGNVSSVKSLYNGNISETYWRIGADNVLRKYGYEYDNLNRLKNAIYQKPGEAIPESGAYNESMSYDKNGNIKFLQRFGNSDAPSIVFQIDDLTYEYKTPNSNQLAKVTDSPSGNDNEGFMDANKSGDDFGYDANGNLITDLNKNITEIIYNHLNLPIKITFATTGTIEYLYDATGKKLEKIVTQGTVVTTTKYLEGFQYTNDVLQYFPTAEGYVSKTGSSYKYVFNYTDHLGNIRLSYAKNATTGLLEILEENNYYPFGLKQKGNDSGLPPTNYKYKYNGKELQDELGLNFYDYGARNYDPAIGRFSVPDPMQELFYGINSYAYVFNNPVQLIDPTGMIVEYANDPNKTKKENRQAKREFKSSQRELNRNSSEAKANWNTLKNSKNVHTIHINEKDKKGNFIDNTTTPKDGYKSGEGNGGGSNIYVNLNKTTVQGNDLGTNIVSIGHEEGHAFRIDQGLVEDDYVSDRANYLDDTNLMKLHISRVMEKEEIETTHIENIIRAQLDPTGSKYPLRATYDNKELYRRNPFNNQVEPYKKTLKTIKDGYNYYKTPQ